MKRLIIFNLAFFLLIGSGQLIGQSDDESTGLLGDNFSLEGALDMFKNASNMEAFEEALNKADNHVNNLDLNDDGDIDYIRVEDNMEGDVHAIVLQALISEDETQDIAVIEIEKTGDESATLQIVGDEDLYGEGAYVEPFEEEGKSDGKGGPSADYKINRIVINVWGWPSVRFIYRPTYVVYRSPFRWKVYPRAWRPWRPLTWSVYHGHRYRYHRHYHRVNTHRIVRARKIYTPKRKSSKRVVTKSRSVTRVKTKNGTTVARKNTKTTTVKKNKNGTVAGKKSTTTTKVKKNKNGTVKGTKTKKTTKVKKGKNGKKGVKKTKTKKVKRKKGN